MRIKRLVPVLGLLAVVAFSVFAVRETTAHPGTLVPLQSFTVDQVNCLNQTTPYSLNANGVAGVSNLPVPLPCAGGAGAETKTLNGEPGTTTYTVINSGTRASLPFSYTGPGWVYAADAAITDGQTVGDIISYIDLFCDSAIDAFANEVGVGGNIVPETYVERTTTFSTTSGPVDMVVGATTVNGALDETFLEVVLPPTSLFSRTTRYRADARAIFLGATLEVPQTGIQNVLSTVVPINLVTMHPAFSPAGVQVNIALLGGAPSPPGTQLLCLDTPQSANTHTLARTNAPQAPDAVGPDLNELVIANPAATGLYVRWTALVSASDPHESDASGPIAHFKVVSNCKAIGATFIDADSDCAATVANGGGPADANDADPDQDDDGLLDGIEAAWGSSLILADTDGDGRSDAEEMIGPAQFLSNPNVADTDTDTVADGGLCVDAGVDGLPDLADANGDNITGDLHGTASTDADGSSHRASGARLVRCAPGATTEGDNCSNVLNGGQANFDAAMPNGDRYGDDCDGDDDQDGINDKLEGVEDAGKMFFDPAAAPVGGVSGANRCRKDDPPGAPVLVDIGVLMSQTDPDFDNDGYLDGVECALGTDPTVTTSIPGFPSTDPDGDGLGFDQERFFRTGVFSGSVNEDVDGDGAATCNTDTPPSCGSTDSDSDGDGLEDRMEAAILGTSPISRDSDGDGIEDQDETFPGSSCGLIAYGNAAIKLFSSRMGFPDTTVPWSAKTSPTDCAGLTDNDGDGLADAGEATGANCGGIATTPGNVSLDITYDDDQDGNPRTGSFGGSDPTDDAVPWDTDGDGQLDGAECNPASLPGGSGGAASNPTSSASKLTAAQCGPVGDTDADGLDDRWENCKWGTNPANTNTDGVAPGDCKEALDVDGNGVINSTGDFVQHARAAFASGTFGKDGIYDIDGNNVINSTGDFVAAAKRIFLQLPCV